MESQVVEHIRTAVQTARDTATRLKLNDCDVSELDELIEPVERELQASQPNVKTLATYLNSLARSLRADPNARTACLELDAAMREAGVPGPRRPSARSFASRRDGWLRKARSWKAGATVRAT